MDSTKTDNAAKDQRYRQLIKSVKNGLYDFDFEKTRKQALDLHKSLDVSKLSRKSLKHGAQEKLIQASIKNQSYRSTIVGLLVNASQFSANLDYEYKLVRNYLLLEYPEQWNDYRTKEERLQAVDYLFEPVLRLRMKYASLIESIKMILDDIDKAAWQIKNILEILKLTSSKQEYNL